MGVKLGDIVPKTKIDFDYLTHKSIAIDFSNFAFQFLSSIRQPDGTPLMDKEGRVTSHLMGIWTRFSNLIQKDIKLVIILDGKPPSLKYKTTEERHARKQEAMQKYETAKHEEDVELMLKYAKMFSYLPKEMVEEATKLMTAMGLPVIQAPEEADAQIAHLCKAKEVDFAASADYDCLLYGTPKMITNLTLSQKRKTIAGYTKTTPELIELEKVLASLNITQDDLIVLSILSGTDYNPGGIKGIGPKKALKLIKEKKDYDVIFKELNAAFDWKEIFSIFKTMKVQKDYTLKWSLPDEQKIKEILVEAHDFSEERVNATLQKLLAAKAQQQEGLNRWFK